MNSKNGISDITIEQAADIVPELFGSLNTPNPEKLIKREEKWDSWPVKWNVTAFNIPYRSDRARLMTLTYWTDIWDIFVERLGAEVSYTFLIKCDGMDANWVTGLLLYCIAQPDANAIVNWIFSRQLLELSLESLLYISKIIDSEIKQTPSKIVAELGTPAYNEDNIGRFVQGIGGVVGYALDLPPELSPLWEADKVFRDSADLRFYRGDPSSIYLEVWEEQFKPRRPVVQSKYKDLSLYEYLARDPPTTSGTSRGTRIKDLVGDERLRVTKAILPQLYTPEELYDIAVEPTIQMTALVKPEIGKQRIAVNASDNQFYTGSFFFDTRAPWMKYPQRSTLSESWQEKFSRLNYIVNSKGVWLPYDFAEFDHQPDLNFILTMWSWWQSKAVQNQGTWDVSKIINRQYDNMYFDWQTPDGKRHKIRVQSGLGSGLKITSLLGLGFNRATTYGIDKDLRKLVPWYAGITMSWDQGDDLEAEWRTIAEAILWYIWSVEVGTRGSPAKMWISMGKTEMLRETMIWSHTDRRFSYNGIVSRAIPSCIQRKPSSVGYASREQKIEQLCSSYSNLWRRCGRDKWILACLDRILDNRARSWRMPAGLLSKVPRANGGLGCYPSERLVVNRKITKSGPRLDKKKYLGDYKVNWYAAKREAESVGGKYGLRLPYEPLCVGLLDGILDYRRDSDYVKNDYSTRYTVKVSQAPYMHGKHVEIPTHIVPQLDLYTLWTMEQWSMLGAHRWTILSGEEIVRDISVLIECGIEKKEIYKVILPKMTTRDASVLKRLRKIVGTAQALDILRSGYALGSRWTNMLPPMLVAPFKEVVSSLVDHVLAAPGFGSRKLSPLELEMLINEVCTEVFSKVSSSNVFVWNFT